jgi:hypothetical protein
MGPRGFLSAYAAEGYIRLSGFDIAFKSFVFVFYIVLERCLIAVNLLRNMYSTGNYIAKSLPSERVQAMWRPRRNVASAWASDLGGVGRNFTSYRDDKHALRRQFEATDRPHEFGIGWCEAVISGGCWSLAPSNLAKTMSSPTAIALVCPPRHRHLSRG